MKVIFLLLLSMFGENSKKNQALDNHFDKYFKKVNEIELLPNLLIGEISYLDVNGDNILVTDRISKKVFLIEQKTGKLLKELSVEKCNPGFNWRPIFAKYTKDGILMLNSIPWGFRFTKSGECIGGMDNSFVAPQRFCSMTNGYIVGYFNDTKPYLAILNSRGKEIKKFGQFDDEFKNFIYRYDGGGIICDRNNIIYQLDACGWNIKKYNENGKLIESIGSKPHFFRKIEKDLSSDPIKAVREFGEIIKGKTLAHSLFFLADNNIIIQYSSFNESNKISFFLQIIDSLGNKVIYDKISTNKPILCTHANKVYIYNQPEAKNNVLPNPKIEVYEFRKKQ